MIEPHRGKVQSDSSEGHMETLVASEEGAGVTLGLPQMRLCCGSLGVGEGALLSPSRVCTPLTGMQDSFWTRTSSMGRSLWTVARCRRWWQG